jgi:hypothetical protein
MKLIVVALLVLFAAARACAAEPGETRDQKGSVILQSDGKARTVHSYSADGKRVRSMTNQDKRVDYDDRGGSNTTSPGGVDPNQKGGVKR